LGRFFAKSRTIMALSVLAFFVGEEVVEGAGLDLVGELVQFAAQCPACPQRRHFVAFALEVGLPR
jgi:hypothetical protein